MPRLTRIAFVRMDQGAFDHRLASGASRYASPKQGYTLREFSMPLDAKRLPPAFESWQPDAVITRTHAQREDILDMLEAGGRPLVAIGRYPQRQGRTIVLGHAQSLFDEIDGHFQLVGCQSIGRFEFSQTPASLIAEQEYLAYAKRKEIEPFSINITADTPEIFEREAVGEISPKLIQWLRDLPKPAGIFTQQPYVGPYVCRVCKHLGISVPEDIAIIGVDGFDVSLWCEPKLSSIWLPAEDIGYEAARLAGEMLAGKPAPTDFVRIGNAEIIARESTVLIKPEGLDLPAALEFIDRHACAGITVDDVVAQTQGISRRSFYDNFRDENHATPATFIRARKLEEARRLLKETELSINTTSDISGYCDSTEFRKVFRKAEGISPKIYRQAQRDKQDSDE